MIVPLFKNSNIKMDPSTSSCESLSEITSFYIQPSDCFNSTSSNGVKVNEEKLKLFASNLFSQIMSGNTREAITSLNNLKATIISFHGRIKEDEHKIDLVNFVIENVTEGLRQQQQILPGINSLKQILENLIKEAKSQRKADPKLKYFPVTPEDLESKIWTLLRLEEKKALFSQSDVPLKRTENSKENQSNMVNLPQPPQQTLLGGYYFPGILTNQSLSYVSSPISNNRPSQKNSNKQFFGNPQFKVTSPPVTTKKLPVERMLDLD